jgi:geranylgeranyl reductase
VYKKGVDCDVMHKEYVDVLIIGAGPAGLRCAEVLGDSNLKVLVLEKNSVVGSKVCAGGVTGLASGEALPKGKAVIFYRHHVFMNGHKRVVHLRHPIFMIDRDMLGDFQLKRAKRGKHVQIDTDSRVVALTHDYAVTQTGDKIYFRYLVGADGARSVVRKYLKLKTKLYVGMHYLIPTTYGKCCWLMAPRRLRSGYVWIFPHKHFTSAGAYFNPKLVTFAKAKVFLKSILEQYGFDYSKAKFETAPINCMYSGIKFKHIFLAGEAAGLVSGASGEGIAYALTSGEDIGRHILTPGYHFEKTYRLLRYKRRQEMALKVLDHMPLLLQDLMCMIFMRLLMVPKLRNYFEGAA